MKAVTLWRPWPWAFIVAGKGVENRTWQLPKSLIGTRVALHAGKTYSDEAAAWINVTFGLSVPCESEHPTGIVATGVYQGPAEANRFLHDPWFVGPVGWVFAELGALPQPVPCRGAQGLWTVPEHLERALA